MTFDRFLLIFARQCAQDFGIVESDDGQRRKLRTASLRCPVTAVCEAMTGKVFNVNCYQRAAAEIGLSPVHAEDIADAADDRADTLRAWKLRGRMMRAAGVQS